MARVLVIDDDASVLGAVGEALRKAGHEPCAVLDGEDGIRLAQQGRFDSAVVDLKLRGRNGLDVTAALHEIQRDLPVLLITGFMDFGVSIESYVRAQPFKFLQKPFTPGQLVAAVDGAIAGMRLTQSRTMTPPPGAEFHGLLGDSAAMRHVYQQLQAYAPTNETVLLLGESGTGKNVAAQAIHALSGRQGPFVAVNCAGIPDALLESELFGHEAGSFTGATGRVVGWFEKAAGGTLLLDEIGEMPASSQAKILRVVETHEFARVGGRQSLRVDVRLVAATNRAIDDPSGSFRQDLFYRLSALVIRMPALRERAQDLAVLAPHLLDTICRELGKPIVGLSTDALRRLAAHRWPGNVRELQQVLKKARMLSNGVEIGVGQVDEVLNTMQVPYKIATLARSSLLEAAERAERAAVEEAVAIHPRLADAARALGIDVRTLYQKRKRYGSGRTEL